MSPLSKDETGHGCSSFRMELETEFTPSDESLKQGRNRSWLL
jgi:hypothetical protein